MSRFAAEKPPIVSNDDGSTEVPYVSIGCNAARAELAEARRLLVLILNVKRRDYETFRQSIGDRLCAQWMIGGCRMGRLSFIDNTRRRFYDMRIGSHVRHIAHHRCFAFMALPPTAGLGRRERQIVELVYRLGEASANDVLDGLPDPPTYSTVRKMLALLEQKGYVKHSVDGLRYMYSPTVRQDVARRSALRHLIDTFFGGSEEALVTTLIADRSLSPKRLEQITRTIDEARHRDAGTKPKGGR